MKRAASVAVALAFAVASPVVARAADFPIDARMPVRVGFAYTGITRAPALSFSWGIDVDVLRIARRLTLELAFDFEANVRPELPDKDPRSSFGGFGLGAGLFYVTDDSVALGFESTSWLTFDNQDLVGGGLSTRAYVIPFYLPITDAAKSRDHLGAWVRSAIAIWAMARVDWTSVGNGGTLSFGASVDFGRIFFLPYLELLTKKLR